MNRLHAELHRLYLLQTPQGLHTETGQAGLIDAGGRVRAMGLELARPADWKTLSPLWRGVQTDLELPAPAIAVNGLDGYQLWFSLAEPVPVAHAQAFLAALCTRYLESIAAERLAMLPALDTQASRQGLDGALPPALRAPSGHWSAFVLPDLAAVFADGPWLDLPPNPEAQADLLSRIESIRPAAFQRALERLGPVTRPATHGAAAAPADGTTPRQTADAALAGPALEPRQFLLAVMNDPCVELPLRLEAAKALLPYF